MHVVLPVITALSCGVSFWLMLRDFDNQKEAAIQAGEENAGTAVFPKSAMVYSAVCVLITVLISAFFTYMFPNNSPWVNVKRMILLSILWPIAYIDFKTLRIPNLFVVYGLICRAVILVFEVFLENTQVWGGLISEVIAAGALLLASILCALAVKNGIGFGDMKLFLVMGLMLGLEGIWGAIFLALIVSFFIAIYVLLTKKKTRKDAIPFGPALVIGAYLSICLSGM